MKKFTAALLALLLALTLTLPALAEEVSLRSAPLLYRVTDAEGHVIYLLGTIHIGLEEMYPLSAPIEAAYQEAEVLAVEIDLVKMLNNMQQMLAYSLAMMYPAEDCAQNHLSPETYSLAVEKLGLPEFALNRMKVGAWVSLADEMALEDTGLSSDYGVDQYLLNRAYADEKPIAELETMDFQLDLLLGMPDMLTEYQLRTILENPEQDAQDTQQLFDAWRRGDAEALCRMLEGDEEKMEELPQELLDAAIAYNERMYTQRNAGFFEQAKAYLASGQKALIAVGAAHIVGEGGVADLLEKAGYQVEEIGFQPATVSL